MKQLSLILGLTLVTVLSTPSYAQEQDDNTIKIEVSDTVIDDSGSQEDGLNVSVNLGDHEDSADEQLRNAAAKLSKVFGKDFGQKVALELDGMSEEEKDEVVEAISKGFSFESSGSDSWSISESLIAFTAIVLSLGMPIIILLLVLVFGYRKRRQKMELVRTYLDAGKDVPEEVLAEFSTGSSNSLKNGITPLAIGAGLIGASFILEDATPLAAFGLIPLFIGIARIAYWKFESKNQQ